MEGSLPNYTITWTGNTITYQYDAVGRLTKKTLPNGRYIAYNYDSAGRRVQMTDYFGGQTSYSYDGLGRLTSIANPFINNSYPHSSLCIDLPLPVPKV
ncbi:MAG: RHS repeat domain-containing protein [bacterium]